MSEWCETVVADWSRKCCFRVSGRHQLELIFTASPPTGLSFEKHCFQPRRNKNFRARGVTRRSDIRERRRPDELPDSRKWHFRQPNGESGWWSGSGWLVDRPPTALQAHAPLTHSLTHSSSASRRLFCLASPGSVPHPSSSLPLISAPRPVQLELDSTLTSLHSTATRLLFLPT